MKLFAGITSSHATSARRADVMATWAQDWIDANVGPLVFVVSTQQPSKHYKSLADRWAYDPDNHLLHTATPDSYAYNGIRFHEMLKWAYDTFDPDFYWTADDDVYTAVPKLLAYPFQQHDYVGQFCRGQGGQYYPYAAGGGGTMFSRKAVMAMLCDPLLERQLQEHNAISDMLIGLSMKHAGIEFASSLCFYSQPDKQPLASNDLITCHYVRGEAMHTMHRIYKESLGKP